MLSTCSYPYGVMEFTGDISEPGITVCCKSAPGSLLCWHRENYYDVPLMEVWNSPRMQEARRHFANQDISAACGNILCNKLDRLDQFSKQLGPASQKQIDNLARAKRHMENGDVVLSSTPIALSFQLDNVCNLRCIMCYLDSVRFGEKRKVAIQLDRMVGLQEFLDNAYQINLLGGEPTLSANYRLIMNMIHERKVVMVTNGMFAQPLIDHQDKIASVVFSIDGGTKETYEAVRINARWERLWENIKQVKKETDIVTACQFTVTPLGCDEMSRFLDKAMEYELNNAYFNEVGTELVNKEHPYYSEDKVVFSTSHYPRYRRGAKEMVRKHWREGANIGFNLRSLGVTSSDYARLLSRVDNEHWQHSIEFPTGRKVHGPGESDSIWEKMGITDLIGKTVLDAGSSDGYFTFKAEDAGAEVTAVDITDHSSFRLASRLMFSTAKCVIADLEDAATFEKLGKHYDAVFAISLLDHLKSPQAFLKRIAEIADTIYVESHIKDLRTEEAAASCEDHHANSPSKRPVMNQECLVEMLQAAGFGIIDLLHKYPCHIMPQMQGYRILIKAGKEKSNMR